MRPSFVLFVVPVSICVVSCTEDNDPGQSCSDPSVCGPTASIEVDLPPSLQTFDHLVKASVTLCRNGDCVTGDFSSLNLPPSPNTGVPIALASTPDGGATSGATALLMATMNNDYWLQVFWPNTLGGAAADGDTYTLTIDDVSGAHVLVTPPLTATKYDVVRPFGNDCPTISRHIDFNQHTS